jgi:glycosyltransferase involved in cell wall biosynthesis
VRLLVVSPFLPDPQAAHGGGLYLGHLCRALGTRVTLGLAALARGGEEGARRKDTTDWGWIGVAPPQDRARGLLRIPHTLRMGWRWGVEGQPLLAAKHRLPAMDALLERALAEFRPDAALVELAQMAQYLPRLAAVPTILTDHEAGLPANSTTGLGDWGDRRDRRLWQSYMRHFYPMADLLQAVTTEDAAELASNLDLDVATRPPTMPVLSEPIDVSRSPPRALFFGSYLHRPNPEAAERLVREILPEIRKHVPEAELWFAGPSIERIAHLQGSPGVRLAGFVEDLTSLFASCRMVLAPLYSGSGVRMKCLSALCAGMPVVTNALGARGCTAPPPGRFVANDTRALVDATVRLLRSPDHARAAGLAAHNWASKHLSAGAVAEAQLARVELLLSKQPARNS